MTRHPEEDLLPLPVGEIRPGEPARPGLDRRRRTVGLGVLLAVFVGAVALAGSQGDDRPEKDEPVPEGWRRGAPGPLRYRDFAVRAWTGSELVVWGGDPDGDSGAAYDPGTDRWRMIAASPITARCHGASTWTGREVLVWGDSCPGSPRPGPGAAAYDPAADRWRVLPAGPVAAGPAMLSVWTGAEWVLADPAGPTAAFDPAGDRWRELPPLPRPSTSVLGQWTGQEVIALGAAESEHWAAALDPVRGVWRDLPGPPLRLEPTAVWDGARLVAWDQNLASASLGPADGSTWKELGELPAEFSDCPPQGALLGDTVFASLCGRGALLRPGRGEWEAIPHPRSLAEAPVWTGHDALFWVGSFAGSADGVWLYRLS